MIVEIVVLAVVSAIAVALWFALSRGYLSP